VSSSISCCEKYAGTTPCRARTALRLALLEDRLEQRRLARAVRPDERDVLAALDRERASVEQHARRRSRPRALRLDDRAAAARRLEELEAELRVCA
jgi:hypothetical protein